MEIYKNLYLIGSSHIAKQSIEEIKNAFFTLSPSVVAVELDPERMQALLSGESRKPSLSHIGRLGLSGYLFALIGSWASKKMGSIVGVSPGTEMKTAILLAKEHKKKLALIDQPIGITLNKFSKQLTGREKWNFVKDLFKGFVLRKKDPLLDMDLSKVPEDKLIDLLVGQVKNRYPTIYRVIIQDRNYFMARRLKRIMKDFPDEKILAVVGAGHKEGILSILKENEGV